MSGRILSKLGEGVANIKSLRPSGECSGGPDLESSCM